MASISASAFVDGFIVEDNDDYLAIMFVDALADDRRPLRYWQLIINRAGGDPYWATKITSDTTVRRPFAPASYEVSAARRLADALLAAAIRDGLLTVNHDTERNP